jgi:DNA-binding transcriptional MocR family regulator
MSDEKRRHLLELAQQYNFHIVADEVPPPFPAPLSPPPTGFVLRELNPRRPRPINCSGLTCIRSGRRGEGRLPWPLRWSP